MHMAMRGRAQLSAADGRYLLALVVAGVSICGFHLCPTLLSSSDALALAPLQAIVFLSGE